MLLHECYTTLHHTTPHQPLLSHAEVPGSHTKTARIALRCLLYQLAKNESAPPVVLPSWSILHPGCPSCLAPFSCVNVPTVVHATDGAAAAVPVAVTVAVAVDVPVAGDVAALSVRRRGPRYPSEPSTTWSACQHNKH